MALLGFQGDSLRQKRARKISCKPLTNQMFYLTLALLMARLGGTDHADAAVATDDLAIPANLANRCSYLHDTLLGSPLATRTFSIALEIGPLHQLRILAGHQVRLNLCHEVHGDHHYDQHRRPAQTKGDVEAHH